MQYLKGYTIKPSQITGVGEVIFTDGTNNDIRANEVQCGAYGYTYDKATGTCRSFIFNTNLISTFWNTSNKINGAQNITQIGTENTQLNGTNNQTLGSNENCFISGSGNTIANGVSNATIIGSNGTALIDGEFVVGSADGISQTSTFFLNGTTTDATPTALFINGDAALTGIPQSSDTCIYYTIDIHAFRTGGASGSGAVGDRAFFTLIGMWTGNENDQSLTTKVARGTILGWTVVTAVVGAANNLQLKVTGFAAMDIKWTATAKFSSMKI